MEHLQQIADFQHRPTRSGQGRRKAAEGGREKGQIQAGITPVRVNARDGLQRRDSLQCGQWGQWGFLNADSMHFFLLRGIGEGQQTGQTSGRFPFFASERRQSGSVLKISVRSARICGQILAAGRLQAGSARREASVSKYTLPSGGRREHSGKESGECPSFMRTVYSPGMTNDFRFCGDFVDF
jgi:hypothetical protein